MFSGIFILEDQDRAFEKKIEKLLDAIEERNNTYEDERKTLRVMMQEEKEEMKRQDDEKRKKRLEGNIYFITFYTGCFTKMYPILKL